MTNPFKWRESREPSIFAKDPYFRAPSSGKTNSEAQTEQVQRRREQGRRFDPRQAGARHRHQDVVLADFQLLDPLLCGQG